MNSEENTMIEVSKETHRKLLHLKVELGAKTMPQLLTALINSVPGDKIKFIKERLEE